jgi:hypothetical protein
MAASRCECTRALGHASPSQRMARSAGGSEQQAGSGHLDVERSLVSRPRIHFTWVSGTPTLSPAGVRSTTAVHQYVPDVVSVYLWYADDTSGRSKTASAVQ